MNDAAMTPDVQLAAWREQGWERLDPVAFFFMEALSRRTAAQEGEARQRLDARMAELIESYAARIKKAGISPQPGDGAAQEALPPSAPLTALSKALTDHAARNKSVLPWTAHYPELPLLDEFQQLWSRVSASMRVQESQFQVPDNAGPLNSSHLVHRSLALMRELAPGYLQHFLAYVDVLSWLEPMVVPAIPQREAAKSAAKSATKAAATSTGKNPPGARKTAAKPARKTTRAKPADKA
ncbi:DUF2894 domain-containing protein [Bordetella sp. LUAb4]|uniref:DUF2894 domain-containing protein n=1 Tax=Bordetella sp. LUAb4 TaxID=2843195 RepID=UPI001E3BAD9B|nr:DUF2894 domain-containing protein [Bordetella sp. LUAb4]